MASAAPVTYNDFHDGDDFDTVLKVADSIHEVYKRQTNGSSVQSTSSEFQDLKAELNSIKRQLAEFNQRDNESGYQSQSRNRSKSKDRETNEKLCFFHYRFGDKARKCGGTSCPKASSFGN